MLDEVVEYANFQAYAPNASIVWSGSWTRDHTIPVFLQGNTVWEFNEVTQQTELKPGNFTPNQNYLEKRGSHAQNYILENESKLEFDWASNGWLWNHPELLDYY